MEVWNIFKNFISDPNCQSFLISLGASITWDSIKFALNKPQKTSTYELQVYSVIKDTFQEFCNKLGFEFDEETIMTTFFCEIQKADDFNSGSLSRRIVSNTIGCELEYKDIDEWAKIFSIVCSNPKYQWLYNKISFPEINMKKEEKNASWMKKHMIKNSCKIQCGIIEDLPPIFNDIKVNIPQKCWYDIQVLIWEIIFNAREHGNANNCTLHISSNSICVVDNGVKFDVMMIQKSNHQGGGIAIKTFIEKYPSISLKNNYEKECNYFTVSFNEDVFDVNGMSEIIVPDLFSGRCKYQLRYPQGRFKYYYIDIDEIPRINNDLFASYSSIIRLFETLKREIIPESKEDKIFIYFSNLQEANEYVYEQMKEVLERDVIKNEGIDIVILTDNLENF